MKRYLILTILFCLYLLPIYGTYYNSNTNNYNRYNGISTKQTIETRRIGYSTNYGHGFNKVTSTAPTYRSTSYYLGNTTYKGTYTPTYGGTTYGNSGSGRPGGGPRKVSGWGWIDWLTWGMYHGVPSDASNEDMEAYYNYCKTHSGVSYEDWYTSVYGTGSDPEGPPSPGDPMLDPIGDCPYWMLFVFVGIYAIYKKYNSLRVKQQIC